MGPAQLRAPGPPRYATRGNLPALNGRDGEKGETPSVNGVCAIRGQLSLNAAYSKRSAKNVCFQKVTSETEP